MRDTSNLLHQQFKENDIGAATNKYKEYREWCLHFVKFEFLPIIYITSKLFACSMFHERWQTGWTGGVEN